MLTQSQWPAPNDVAISVADGTNGSGVKGVEVTLAGAGLSDAIPTTYDQTSGHWIAAVNDAAIHRGVYTLTVKATDNAGNTGTIANQKLTLPLRASTSLSVSAGFTVKANNKTNAQTKRQAKAKAAACKNAHGKTKTAKPEAACGTKAKAKANEVKLKKGTLTTPYGQAVKVAGKLVNTVTNKAIPHAG